MKAPESAEIFETATSKYWFEEGFLCAITKKAPAPPFETVKEQIEKFKKQLDGKKICAVIDITNASPSSREAREHNTKVLPELFKAIAFITGTPLGRIMATMYLGMKPPPFPTKVFSNEEDAKKWIRTQL